MRHRRAGEGEHLGNAELLTSGRQAKRLTLVACILGSGIAFLDSTIVNVALPSIQRDLGGGLSAQQWVVDAYLLTLGALLLVGGSLGDLLGERRVFATGVGAFGVCSALCAAAPNMPTLIAARGLQGVAGALLTPSSLAVIVRTFPPRERGRAIGSWTAWSGIALVIGPLLGGELLAVGSWRWIFLVNVPIAAVTVALVLGVVPSWPAPGGRLDWIGAALCVAGLGGTVAALIEQRRLGWSSPAIVVPLVAGIVLLVAFVHWEHRAPAPMLPLRLFANRNFSVANLETFAVYAGLSTLSFFLVLFLQQLDGWSPLRAGAALLPVTIVMFLLSRLAGGWASRFGPRLFMGLGPLVGGLALLWLVRLEPGFDYATELLPVLLVFALGLSLTVAPLTATVLADAGDRDAGIASGTNTAVARVAGLLGIALVGLAVTGEGNRLDLHGFHLAMLVTALLVATGGAVGALGIVNR